MPTNLVKYVYTTYIIPTDDEKQSLCCYISARKE